MMFNEKTFIEKMFNIINHQGNTNQNHFIPSRVAQTIVTRRQVEAKICRNWNTHTVSMGSNDGKAAVGNSLAVVHQVIETRSTTRFSNSTPTYMGNRTKKHRFTHKSVHECLYQHYSQLSKCGNNPNVHQLVKRSTKCASIQ